MKIKAATPPLHCDSPSVFHATMRKIQAETDSTGAPENKVKMQRVGSSKTGPGGRDKDAHKRGEGPS